MRRPLIALAATAVLAMAPVPTVLAPPSLAINPELVNPVVVSSAFGTGSLTPQVSPTGVAPPTFGTGFWEAPNGTLPVLTTPTPEQPEIMLADVNRRMSILYVTDPAAREIIGGSQAMRALPWLFRQEPSNSARDAALAGDGSQRMNKVSGAGLASKKTADEMKAMLRKAVDKKCTTPAGANTCGAHQVGVDEIGAAFGSKAGDTSSDTPGHRLNTAMAALAKEQFRPGESYASRIHFYVAPGVSTSISEGLGPQRDLGRNGVEMRRDYSQVMSAMSRAGGVWIEMYHYPGRGKPRTPFTAAEWRDVPTRFAGFLKQRTSGARDPLDYLHFVMTETAGPDAPQGEACVARVVGAGQAPMLITPIDDQVVNTIITNQPQCPDAPPPCQVLQPGGSPNQHARTWPMLPRAVQRTGTPGKYDRLIQQLVNQSLVNTNVTGNLQLVLMAPGGSAMTCQWQRAQAGDVNTRILANGPAAFKITGAEAAVFGQQFRQFFLVG